MSARVPRVSVVLPCFNHERWVTEAITSVLEQTMPDFELIVVDDGSRDQSLVVVSQSGDPRLRVLALGENRGGAAALNVGIGQARAELVAVLNSDDAWEPSKLERQLAVLELHPELGAVFTSARLVDEFGSALDPAATPPWHDVFRQPNRRQAEWLRFFFDHGNALCHPSVLIRRRFYAEQGLYDNRLRQLPDFERWIALVKWAPIVVLGEDLVRFRLLAPGQNVSSSTRENITRCFFEHLAIAERFFEGCSDELLLEAFPDLLNTDDLATAQRRACATAWLWLHGQGPLQLVNRAFAMRALHQLLGHPDTAARLRERYCFTDLDLHQLAGSNSAALPAAVRDWLAGLESSA